MSMRSIRRLRDMEMIEVHIDAHCDSGDVKMGYRYLRYSLVACNVIFFIVLASASFSARSTQTSTKHVLYLHPNSLGAKKILESGNSGALMSLSKSQYAQAHKWMKYYALSAYYRSVFSLQKSSFYARACYENAITEPVSSTVSAIIRCGQFLAGNDLFEGNVSGWAHMMQKSHDETQNYVQHRFPGKSIIYPSFGTSDNRIYMKDYYHFPNTVVRGGQKTFVIPRIKKSSKLRMENPVYYVRLRVNGHSVDAVLDTGSTISLVSQEEASRLGIHVNPAAFYKLGTKNFHNPFAETHLGYVKRLSFDKIPQNSFELLNSKIVVEPEEIPDAKMVFGLNMLRHLGVVLVSKTGVTVRPNIKGLRCHIHFHVASVPVGWFGILFRYPVNGQMRNVAIDTGSNDYLEAAGKENYLKVYGFGRSKEITANGTINQHFYLSQVGFGSGKSYKYLKIRVYPHLHAAAPFVLGSGVLKDFSIYLDFEHDLGCLFPRKEVKIAIVH